MSALSSSSPERQSERLRPRPAFGRRQSLLVLLGASLALAACGKKGALELPPADDEPAAGDAG